MRPSLAGGAGYQSYQSPLLAERKFCRKSSMNMSIDNQYCHWFIHNGRLIFSVNRSGASVYNPYDIWERACAVLHSWGTARPVCDPSRIIATRQLNALTVPWSHYVSKNCIYIQSHLLRWYKLNCNRFDHREKPIFSQHRPPATIRHFFLLRSGDCAMTSAFHMLQKICRVKLFITIYFYTWTQHKPIVAIIKACRSISIKY